MGAEARLTAPRIVAPPGAAHTLAVVGIWARATTTGEPPEELGITELRLKAGIYRLYLYLYNAIYDKYIFYLSREDFQFFLYPFQILPFRFLSFITLLLFIFPGPNHLVYFFLSSGVEAGAVL